MELFNKCQKKFSQCKIDFGFNLGRFHEYLEAGTVRPR